MGILRAAVQGVGVVSPLGVGVDRLTPQAPEELAPARADHPDGSHCVYQGIDDAVAGEYLPKRALRRIDHYGRLALAAAVLACRDAGLGEGGELPRLGARTALVIATGHGSVNSTFAFLDSMIEGNDQLSSPTHFSNSVHNAAAAHVSMLLHVTGPNLTVTDLDAPLWSALASGLALLHEGSADRVLLGTIDEFSPVYARIIDRDRGERVTHGEGAAFFVLAPAADSGEGVTVELARGDLAGDGFHPGRPGGAFAGTFPTEGGFGLARLLGGTGEGIAGMSEDRHHHILVRRP